MVDPAVVTPASQAPRARVPADVVDLEAVSIERSGKTLLDRVDWQVEEGERWAVLGPNGAGKTTLLQVASTHLHPTRGTARVLGEQLGRVDVFELRPRIGLASAQLASRVARGERVLDVVVTASYGVVGRWREQYDGEDLARAQQLLELLGVGRLGERAFGTLSSGEQKRVLVARALMTDPELLLLDEPASGLDLGGREDLVARLARIAADPAAPTFVLVTHHVEEIPAGTTHALLLREGRAVSSGPVEEALTAPALSHAFGLRVALDHRDGRWAARAVRV